MIHGIIVVNNNGKVRLTKFFNYIDDGKQQTVIRDCFNLVSKRPDGVYVLRFSREDGLADTRMCNFIESYKAFGADAKIVYRHYATLYFCFVVDRAESELGILDLIQVFVETLDGCFENVCELDLIFHSDKVHFILDEIVMGGLVLETNSQDVRANIVQMTKLEQQSMRSSISTKLGQNAGTKF